MQGDIPALREKAATEELTTETASALIRALGVSLSPPAAAWLLGNFGPFSPEQVNDYLAGLRGAEPALIGAFAQIPDLSREQRTELLNLLLAKMGDRDLADLSGWLRRSEIWEGAVDSMYFPLLHLTVATIDEGRQGVAPRVPSEILDVVEKDLEALAAFLEDYDLRYGLEEAEAAVNKGTLNGLRDPKWPERLAALYGRVRLEKLPKEPYRGNLSQTKDVTNTLRFTGKAVNNGRTLDAYLRPTAETLSLALPAEAFVYWRRLPDYSPALFLDVPPQRYRVQVVIVEVAR